MKSKYSSEMLIVAITAFAAVSGLAFVSPALAAEIELVDQQLFGCSKMQVKFSGMPLTSTAKGNWIAVAEEGAPKSVVTFRQKYLPVATSGVVDLSTLGLIPFKPYELRAYLDWEGTHSYDIASSVPFSVLPAPRCEPAFISRVTPVITQGEALEFSFEDVQLSDSNWVALAVPSDVAWRFKKTTYLPKAKRGTHQIATTDLPPGEYQLRLFQKWKENKDYFIYDSVTVRIE
jgi:hypothetical protein